MECRMVKGGEGFGCSLYKIGRELQELFSNC